MARRTSKSLNPDPATFLYDVRCWQGDRKILRERHELTRSRLTDIPDTRPLVKELCERLGVALAHVPLHLRADRVLWRIGDVGDPVWIEVKPL